jgi:hypothetical protein
MTRAVDRKITVWMAGYYDDFMGARTVPDDLNVPTDTTYYNYKSHQGNPINGWANLNPRYAYAMVERAQLNNNALSTEEGGKFNGSMTEWIGYDQNRRSGGNKYEGLAIPQYPDSLTNANRQRYNAAATTDSHEGYLRFTYAHDTNNSYYAATGLTDSTFGRDVMNYPAKTDGTGLDNSAGLPTTASTPTSMIRTHTAGAYAGIKVHTSTTAISGLTYPIESPSGQPFLVQEVYSNSTSYVPILAYDGTLNSKGDGDIFTIRIAPLELSALGSSGVTGAHLKIQVGCEGTAWTSASGGDTTYANKAVELILQPSDFIQQSVIQQNSNFGNYTQPNMANVWIDYDFEFDYTNGQYNVYKNGTKIVTNGAIGNKADGTQFEAGDMYGWNLQAMGAQKKVAVLIDRVGLIRPLNDHPSGVDMPPAVSMSYNSGSNSLSTLSISVIDDDQQLALMPLFNQSSYSDWSVLMFRNAVDRPIWRGSVTGMTYQNDAVSRTPTIQINAQDYFSSLDKQLPTWEMGSTDDGTQTSQVAYDRSESQNKLDVYYMGATRNQRANATLGFNEVEDGSGVFKKHLDSRMRNRTAHPIQMYSDEDDIGPNDAYDDWDDAITAGHATSDAQYRSIHSRWLQDLPKSAWFKYMFARIKPTAVELTLASTYIPGDATMSVNGIHPIFDTNQILGVEFRDADGFVDSGVATSAAPANSATGLRVSAHYVSKFTRASSTAPIGTNTPGGYYYYTVAFAKSLSPSPLHQQVKLSFPNYSSLDGTYYFDNIKSETINGTACWVVELATLQERTTTVGATTFTSTVKTRFKNFVAQSSATSLFVTADPVGLSTGLGRLQKTKIGQIGNTKFYKDLVPLSKRIDGIRVKSIATTRSGTAPFTIKWGPTTLTMPTTNFLQKRRDSTTKVYIREYDDDFKHIWILWADARNDGTANADGEYRKTEYGLLAPYAGNYDLTLSFAEENISNATERQTFTDLAIGQDIDLWEMGGTDPVTGAAWSAVSGGSNSESNNKYHNWEDKAGSFLIIDSSKFFNLNTQSNGGMAGATSGGRREIGDYLVETEGFPVLIDNYWDKSPAMPHTIDESASWNGNYKYLYSKNTSLAIDIEVGDSILYLTDPSIVPTPSTIGTGTNGVVGQIVSNDKKKVFHMNVVSGELTTYSNYAHGSNEGFKVELNAGSDFTGLVNTTGEALITMLNYDYYNKLRTGQKLTLRSRTSGGLVMTTGSFTEQEYAIVKHGTVATSRGGVAGNYPYIVIKLDDEADSCTTAGYVDFKIPNGFLLESLSFLGVPSEFTGAAGEWNGSGYGGANSAESLQQAKGFGTNSEVAISTSTETDTPNSYPDARVHFGLANIFPMRLLMELNGFVKNKGALTYYDHDKFRVTWMDCMTATWLKQTRLYGMWDINTLPVSKQMSTTTKSASIPGETGEFSAMTESSGTVTATSANHALQIGASIIISASDKLNVGSSEVTVVVTATPDPNTIQFTFAGFNASGSTLGSWRATGRYDSYGSVNDCRNTSISNIFSTTEQSSGTGDDYGTTSTFSWLMGRDSMPSYRPTYGSGFTFNQNNLRMSNLSTSSQDQITNVRVFYGGSAQFVDYPTATLNSSPRWEIINQPDITSQVEALAVAKSEYEKFKSAPLSINAKVTRFGDGHNFYGDTGVMLDEARYGYIADVSRTVTESTYSATLGYAWTSLHGGNLFPGRVNALDSREGGAGSPNAATGTDTYDNLYGFYGANSISYAVQIVHIPKGMPKIANRTPATSKTLGDGHLRVFVDLADQGGLAQESTQRFTVYLADYDFDIPMAAPPNSLVLTPTLVGTTSCEIDASGYYEISIPSSYWPDQVGDERITFSVNYEYLMALRRNRCGSSNQQYSSGNITGVTTWSTTNADSIFPLGCRKFGVDLTPPAVDYNLENAYWTRLAEWFGPRLHVVDDINFVPSTTLLYTDANFAMTNEPLVIQKINWTINGRDTEQVNLTLERDVSRAAKDFSSYIIPQVSKGGTSRRQPGTHTSTGSQKPNYAGVLGGADNTGPPHGKVGFGDVQPGLKLGDALVPITTTGSNVPDNAKPSENVRSDISSNAISNGINNRIKGVMDFNNDSVTGGSFAVLGQTKPSAAPRDTSGMNALDSHITPASGDAVMGSDGMVFPGSADNTSPYTSFKIKTRVPATVASNDISVSGRASLTASTGDGKLYITVECLDTGDSEEKEVVIPQGTDGNVVLYTGQIEGAGTANNNLLITIERTPGSDGDNAQYGSVTMKNVQVSFDRNSVAGSSQSSSLSY